MKGGIVGLRSVDERALLALGVHEGRAEILISMLYALMRVWSGVVIVLLEGVVRMWRVCRGPVQRIRYALRALVFSV